MSNVWLLVKAYFLIERNHFVDWNRQWIKNTDSLFHSSSNTNNDQTLLTMVCVRILEFKKTMSIDLFQKKNKFSENLVEVNN